MRKNVSDAGFAPALARALQPRNLDPQVPQSPVGSFAIGRPHESLHQVHKGRQTPKSRRDGVVEYMANSL